MIHLPIIVTRRPSQFKQDFWWCPWWCFWDHFVCIYSRNILKQLFCSFVLVNSGKLFTLISENIIKLGKGKNLVISVFRNLFIPLRLDRQIFMVLKIFLKISTHSRVSLVKLRKRLSFSSLSVLSASSLFPREIKSVYQWVNIRKKSFKLLFSKWQKYALAFHKAYAQPQVVKTFFLSNPTFVNLNRY